MKLRKAFLLVALLSVQTTRAAILTVTSTADSGPGSLREALAGAADGDTINFSVTGTILLINDTGTANELSVNKSVTIAGPGADHLTVDTGFGSRVFRVTPFTAVTIAGLTIAHGNGGVSGGGGIYNDHATLIVSACVLSDNVADQGAAIYNNHGVLTVSNCVLAASYSGNGGGIYNDGSGLGGSASVRVMHSVLRNNTGSDYGGAIYNFGALGGSASVEITNSTLSGNSAGYGGGGIGNNGYSGSASARIANSTLSDNQAGSGGGIVAFGGGSSTTTVEIVNSTLSGNLAGGGGGVFNSGIDNHATLRIINSTLSGNSSYGESSFQGGGIFNYSYSVGFAIVEIGSTILKTGTTGENILNFGTVTSLGYNLSSDSGVNNVEGYGIGSLTATGDQIDTDPLLLPLRDNGGSTFTHALLGCSPALDQGKNFDGLATDQRDAGFGRSIDNPETANATGGDGTDVGALEAQAAKPAAEQVGDLIVYLQSLPIDSGVKNGLLVKLQDALNGVNGNKQPKACSALQDFINLCNAQLAKRKLTAAQANALICEATHIRAVIGCK